MVGKTLGHYEILEPLGAGGMGEVYRARDTTLDRDVAIKVLPEEFAANHDRLARLEREAKLLASLNHANIAAIYGLDDEGDQRFIAMELVEGETLAERLAASGRIEVGEALEIAHQIAEALEAAHDNGIIHRDLKPANVKVTPEGKVKVLDFGLAKAYEADGQASGASPDLSHSPTITVEGTQTGVIQGTAAYMSPEQARGKPLDKRTDIFSFGCLLYEMLTGNRPFVGEDVSETMAAILKEEPDWNRLARFAPAQVQRLLRRCLQKDIRLRLRDIGDAWVELGEALAEPSRGSLAVSDKIAPSVARHRLLSIVLVATVVVAGTIITGLPRWSPTPPASPPPPVTRFAIVLPPGETLLSSGQRPVAISPDGTRLVYVANQQLHLRGIAELVATPIPGTQDLGRLRGGGPFFSPDGQWVGFWSAGQLKKVSVNGGAPVTLANDMVPRGASWEAADTILIGQGTRGIWQVPAGGGEPELLIPMENGESALGPQVLPGGEAVLFTLGPSGNRLSAEAQIVIQSLGTGKRTVVVERGRNAAYLASGHLLYGLGGTLFAQAIDLAEVVTLGDPVPVVEGVAAGIPGAVHFSVSTTGTLVYVPGPLENTVRTLVWVGRDGREEPLGAEPLPYDIPRVSPDGTRVAVEVAAGASTDLHIYDLERDTLTRLTFDPDSDSNPVWTPDGEFVLFGSARDGGGIFKKAVDGTGEAEHVVASTGIPRPQSWSGERLIFYHDGGQAFYSVTMDGEQSPLPLLEAPFFAAHPEVSPDGRWLAYTSDESGELDVYVRPFPNVNDGKWQISRGGGLEPVWSPDGRELFYRKDNALLAVPIETEPTFRPGRTVVLFEGAYLDLGPGRQYDIAPDGQRFLMLKAGTETTHEAPDIVVVLNWIEELKRLVPTAR